MSKIRLHYLDVLSRKTIISNTHFFLSFCIVTCEQLTEFKYLLHIFGKMLVMHKMPTVKNPNPNLKKNDVFSSCQLRLVFKNHVVFLYFDT